MTAIATAPEPWQTVFREGLAPLLSPAALVALREALECDDGRLMQWVTVSPPPLTMHEHDECDGACLIGFCGWIGEGLETVGEVEEYFARTCCAVDGRIGEYAGVRKLLNAWDETPREEIFREVLAEVRLEIARRVREAS